MFISQLPEKIKERAIPLAKKAWNKAGNEGDPNLETFQVAFIDRMNAPEGKWYWELVLEGRFDEAIAAIAEGYVLTSLFTKGIQKKILYLETKNRSLSYVHRGYLRPLLKSQVCFDKAAAEERAIEMFQEEIKKLHLKIEKHRASIVKLRSKKE